MRILPLLFLTVIAAQDAAAQEVITRAEDAVVITSGRGEVRVAPDEALIRIGVATSDTSASMAAAETGRKLSAIIDTLVQLGYPSDSMPTVGYGVRPEYRPEEGPRRYQATGAVEVPVRELSRIPEVIDAALAAGANNIPYIQLRVRDTSESRTLAIARGFEEARRDAEALARAAGGELGRIIELSTRPLSRGYEQVQAMARMPSPEFTPQDITISVTITAKWEYRERGS